MRWNKKGSVATDESVETIMYWLIGTPIFIFMIAMAFSLSDRAFLEQELNIQNEYYLINSMSSLREGHFNYHSDNANMSFDNNYLYYIKNSIFKKLPLFFDKNLKFDRFELNQGLKFGNNYIIENKNDELCSDLSLPKNINVKFDFAFQNDIALEMKRNIIDLLTINDFNIYSDPDLILLFKDHEFNNNKRIFFDQNNLKISKNAKQYFCGEFDMTDNADLIFEINFENGIFFIKDIVENE